MIKDFIDTNQFTKQELLDIAAELEGYKCTIAAGLVREAAEVYEKRGRLKKF